jgi:hypothetical protein
MNCTDLQVCRNLPTVSRTLSRSVAGLALQGVYIPPLLQASLLLQGLAPCKFCKTANISCLFNTRNHTNSRLETQAPRTEQGTLRLLLKELVDIGGEP